MTKDKIAMVKILKNSLATLWLFSLNAAFKDTIHYLHYNGRTIKFFLQ
jgi:uncharacterized membrane protein YoaK (UPF0700 family)